jgi:hypothetical protein
VPEKKSDAERLAELCEEVAYSLGMSDLDHARDAAALFVPRIREEMPRATTERLIKEVSQRETIAGALDEADITAAREITSLLVPPLLKERPTSDTNALVTEVRLRERVAYSLDVYDVASAREVTALLVPDLRREEPELDDERLPQAARRRCFLEVDDSWSDVIDGLDTGPRAVDALASAVESELVKRVPPRELELHDQLRRHGRRVSMDLAQSLTEGARNGVEPGHLKHRACSAVWRAVVCHYQQREWTDKRAVGVNYTLSYRADDLGAKTVQLARFSDIVDLRRPQTAELVMAATPRESRLPWSVEYDDEKSLERNGRPLEREPEKPPKTPRPTEKQRREEEERARRQREAQVRLGVAVASALVKLAKAKSGYVEIIDRIANGDVAGLPEAKLTRAHHALVRAMEEYGFYCGVAIEKPGEHLFARHVVAAGVECDLSTLTDEQRSVFELELAGEQIADIARGLGLGWPEPEGAGEAWRKVADLLDGLQVPRQAIRTQVGHIAIYEGDPYSRKPAGMPKAMVAYRSAARQEKALAEIADLPRCYEYGRVILLPESAVKIDKKASRKAAQEVDRTHVGDWYMVPLEVDNV